MASAPGDPVAVKPHDWAGAAGERWAASLDQYETMLAQVGVALLDQAVLVPGLTVAEIGCGGGAVSRAIAGRVAPDGRVVGVDISPTLISLCRRRAEGIANARFVTADAGSVRLDDAPFDRILSRFGIMFFAEPASAFANLRTLLKRGGRADFAVWGAPAENKAVAALPLAAGRHLDLPPADPRAPGPFAFSDPDYFRTLLEQAGFAAVAFREWRGDVLVGGRVGVAEAARFALNSSALADIVAAQPDSVRGAILADMEELLAPFARPAGVAVPSAVWLVTATTP